MRETLVRNPRCPNTFVHQAQTQGSHGALFHLRPNWSLPSRLPPHGLHLGEVITGNPGRNRPKTGSRMVHYTSDAELGGGRGPHIYGLWADPSMEGKRALHPQNALDAVHSRRFKGIPYEDGFHQDRRTDLHLSCWHSAQIRLWGDDRP